MPPILRDKISVKVIPGGWYHTGDIIEPDGGGWKRSPTEYDNTGSGWDLDFRDTDPILNLPDPFANPDPVIVPNNKHPRIDDPIQHANDILDKLKKDPCGSLGASKAFNPDYSAKGHANYERGENAFWQSVRDDKPMDKPQYLKDSIDAWSGAKDLYHQMQNADDNFVSEILQDLFNAEIIYELIDLAVDASSPDATGSLLDKLKDWDLEDFEDFLEGIIEEYAKKGKIQVATLLKGILQGIAWKIAEKFAGEDIFKMVFNDLFKALVEYAKILREGWGELKGEFGDDKKLGIKQLMRGIFNPRFLQDRDAARKAILQLQSILYDKMVQNYISFKMSQPGYNRAGCEEKDIANFRKLQDKINKAKQTLIDETRKARREWKEMGYDSEDGLSPLDGDTRWNRDSHEFAFEDDPLFLVRK